VKTLKYAQNNIKYALKRGLKNVQNTKKGPKDPLLDRQLAVVTCHSIAA
jgi:hypothetical protein